MISKLGDSIEIILAECSDCSSTIDSPTLNLFSFLYKIEISSAAFFSANIATAPLICPTILSPIINSDVVDELELIVDRNSFGELGSSTSVDSNIP